jgi:hypothetical protein
MNADDLLDYQLGQMDDARRERFEQELAADPALAGRSARLARALHDLLDDGPPLDAPADLAARTIARVDQARNRPRILEFAPNRVPFRWADLAVAAGIFLAGLATLLPAVQRSRSQMQESACAFNLQKIGLALSNYAATHGSYPHTPPGYPAGYYAVELREQKLLDDTSVLTCPCRGDGARIHTLPTCRDFEALMADSPADCQQRLGEAYAYHAGFRRPEGDYVAVPAELAQRAPMPLVADQPPRDDFLKVLPEGNSPDHGGGGQNVLFSDQSVRWLRSRVVPTGPDTIDLDIYLNSEHKPGIGAHAGDVSLIPAGFRVEAP